MEYKILVTEEFERDFEKCDGSIKKQIEKEIDQLKINPYVGKPLGYEFLREKKAENYRFYYLIFKEQIVVFVLALSTKKNQQKVIDRIKQLIPFYKEEVKRRFNF